MAGIKYASPIFNLPMPADYYKGIQKFLPFLLMFLLFFLLFSLLFFLQCSQLGKRERMVSSISTQWLILSKMRGRITGRVTIEVANTLKQQHKGPHASWHKALWRLVHKMSGLHSVTRVHVCKECGSRQGDLKRRRCLLERFCPVCSTLHWSHGGTHCMVVHQHNNSHLP